MTVRQQLLKWVYPLWMRFTRSIGKHSTKRMGTPAKPGLSFHSLNAVTNTGEPFDFSMLKGKSVLLVNTASDCGFTNQYAELNELYQRFRGRLEILAFPSNDFKEQEKGTDEEIAKFCQVNFGIEFPLMKKSVVVKAAGQNPVFAWLTTKEQNGWNDHPPGWNFTKFLVDETGRLAHVFGASISPLDPQLLREIDDKQTSHDIQ